MKEFLAIALVCLLAVSARAAEGDRVPEPAGQDKTPYPTDGWAERDAERSVAREDRRDHRAGV